MTDMSVVGLYRYPVKSMGGEPVCRLSLGPYGVVGDRVLALVAVETGRVLTARRMPELLRARARWCGTDVVITLPGGQMVRDTDPAAAGVLGEWLGRRVRLTRPAARGEGPAGGLVDEAPLHLLSEGALREAHGWHPDGDWDVRRFRPNLLVRAESGQPVESDLVGRVVSIGSGVINVTGRCRRCVMVTQPQENLAQDRNVLRSLIARSDASFGVYAAVHRSGVVRIGDRAVALGYPEPTLASSPAGEMGG